MDWDLTMKTDTNQPTPYATRYRDPNPALRSVLTVDQALSACAAHARGESVPSIARRFRATHAAVLEALEECAGEGQD